MRTTVTCLGLLPGLSWTTSNGTVDTREFSEVKKSTNHYILKLTYQHYLLIS